MQRHNRRVAVQPRVGTPRSRKTQAFRALLPGSLLARKGVMQRALVGFALAVMAYLALPSSAHAVTRCEAIARAQAWVDAGVMYSWDAWYTDPTTGSCCYRSDCSGLVSAAWGLPAPGNTTYHFAGGPWDDGSSYVITPGE